MKDLLLLLVVIWAVALAIFGYVFLGAARRFVSDPGYVPRSKHDRRQNPDRRLYSREATFPLIDCNGVLVEMDRRFMQRRQSAERRRRKRKLPL